MERRWTPQIQSISSEQAGSRPSALEKVIVYTTLLQTHTLLKHFVMEAGSPAFPRMT